MKPYIGKLEGHDKEERLKYLRYVIPRIEQQIENLQDQLEEYKQEGKDLIYGVERK